MTDYTKLCEIARIMSKCKYTECENCKMPFHEGTPLAYCLDFDRSVLPQIADAIESLQAESAEKDKRIAELEAENNNYFYKLTGVMHSVDKWLDGDELEQDEVNRAITMREKTLQIAETLQAERDAAVADIERLLRETINVASCGICANDGTALCEIHKIPPRCDPKWRGVREGEK